jgi:hypothetical protein
MMQSDRRRGPFCKKVLSSRRIETSCFEFHIRRLVPAARKMLVVTPVIAGVRF